MGDLQKTFGLLIAWLIPGGAALFGAFQWGPLSDQYRTIVERLELDRAATVTLIGLTAFAFGLMISVWRELLFQPHIKRLTKVTPAQPDMNKLTDPNKLALFREVIENSFRFFQYKANLAIGLLVAVVFHWMEKIRTGDFSVSFSLSLLFVIALGTLVAGAIDEYKSFCDRVAFAA